MNTLGTARDLAASDTANATFTLFMVAGAGGSVVVQQRDGTTITLASVPTNVWVPCGDATNIKTTSTATGFIVV